MKSVFASLLLITACSGDPLDPGAGDNAGTGTKTLTVDGDAHAHPRIANAKEPVDFDTDFDIRISINGVAVQTGTVTVTSKSSKTNLVWSATGGPLGSWHGVATGYDEVYQLDVISGPDKVEGVIVDGPDIHAFTAPMAGASVDSTMPLEIKWSRDDVADQAGLDAENVDRISVQDTGTFMLPPNSLKSETNRTRPNTIELRRDNQISPAGAVAGSSFLVRVTNEIDVIALANPAQ